MLVSEQGKADAESGAYSGKVNPHKKQVIIYAAFTQTKTKKSHACI